MYLRSTVRFPGWRGANSTRLPTRGRRNDRRDPRWTPGSARPFAEDQPRRPRLRAFFRAFLSRRFYPRDLYPRRRRLFRAASVSTRSFPLLSTVSLTVSLTAWHTPTRGARRRRAAEAPRSPCDPPKPPACTSGHSPLGALVRSRVRFPGGWRDSALRRRRRRMNRRMNRLRTRSQTRPRTIRNNRKGRSTRSDPTRPARRPAEPRVRRYPSRRGAQPQPVVNKKKTHQSNCPYENKK